MKSHSLFLLNLLVSVCYLVIQQFFQGTIHTVSLLLMLFFFLYTSQKIRELNQDNPYLFSRGIIQLFSILLIGNLFGRYENAFGFSLAFILAILAAEAYELLFKHPHQPI